MKAPAYWQYRNIVTEALFPFSVIYYLFSLLKEKRTKPVRFDVPVVCVGNYTLGGAGKTPTAIAICQLLKEEFKHIAFVSRGYGGALKGPVKVNPETHTARQVGDEPLLLARHAPCYIAKKRVEGIALAIKEGAELVILDDGMQNPTFEKTLTLAVIDGGYGFGNEYLFPAGPLREPLPKAFKKTDAVLFSGTDIFGTKEKLPKELTLFDTSLESFISGVPRKNYLAFAGIGRPQKFFQSLISHGVFLRHTKAFSDHYPYTPNDVENIKKEAAENGCDGFITTEKDAVRLPKEFLDEVQVFPVEMAFTDIEGFKNFLLEKLRRR